MCGAVAYQAQEEGWTSVVAQDGGVILRPKPESVAARQERRQAAAVQALLFTRLRPLLILRMVKLSQPPSCLGCIALANVDSVLI